MGARFYDSYIARWLSADTIVPDFTKPQSLNRYSYIYNRPLNLTDPSGHCPPEDQSCKPHMEDESAVGVVATAYTAPNHRSTWQHGRRDRRGFAAGATNDAAHPLGVWRSPGWASESDGEPQLLPSLSGLKRTTWDAVARFMLKL